MTMIIGIYSSDFPRCGDTGEGIFCTNDGGKELIEEIESKNETLGVP
ncbi:MAG: hypothetical protein ABIT08_13670 [Bacteroidia bacterium]